MAVKYLISFVAVSLAFVDSLASAHESSRIRLHSTGTNDVFLVTGMCVRIKPYCSQWLLLQPHRDSRLKGEFSDADLV